MINQTKDDNKERKELSLDVMKYLDDFVRKDDNDFQHDTPIRITHFSFHPVDSLLTPEIIDAYKIHNIIWSYDTPVSIKKGKVDDSSCMENKDLVEIFNLSSGNYESNIFGKKKLRNHHIKITYKNYCASNVHFNSKRLKKYYKFRDGKAYPYALYITNNESARAELEAAIMDMFTQLKVYEGNKFDKIGTNNSASGSVSSLFESYKQRTSAVWSHVLQPTCGKIKKELYNLQQIIGATSRGTTMKIGTIFYDLILPDDSVLTREKLVDYYNQTAKRILKNK